GHCRAVHRPRPGAGVAARPAGPRRRRRAAGGAGGRGGGNRQDPAGRPARRRPRPARCPGPVMLVLTFRSDELHRAHPLRGPLGELARNRRVQRLELPRFTRAELAEQLAALLAGDPPARVAEDIYARSEGNPFFAEELLRAGEGRGLGALPSSLQEVLLARVVRLRRGPQQRLRVAAAAGPGATQPLLAAVAGMDDAALLDGLREAVDQQLLLPEPGGEVPPCAGRRGGVRGVAARRAG